MDYVRIILDNKRGLNIKLRTRVESLISWLYMLNMKEKKEAQAVKA